MKREYVSPKMEISWLEGEDIIYASNSDSVNNENKIAASRRRLMSLREAIENETETESITETETEEDTETVVSKENEIESMIETKGQQWSQPETESVIEKIVEDVSGSFSQSWFDNNDTGNVGESVSSDVEKSDNTDRSIEYDDYDDNTSSGDSSGADDSGSGYDWSDGGYDSEGSHDGWFEDN